MLLLGVATLSLNLLGLFFLLSLKKVRGLIMRVVRIIIKPSRKDREMIRDQLGKKYCVYYISANVNF